MKTKDWQFKTGGVGAAHIGMFGRPRILMDDNKDKGGGGGDDKDKPALSEEAKKEIAEIINAAFSDREKRSAKARSKEITDAITAALAPVLEKINAAGGDPGDEGDKDKDKGGKKGGKDVPSNLPPEIQAMLKKQADEIAALKKDNETTKAEKEAERKERMTNEENALLTEALNGKVRPGTMKALMTYLRGGRLVRDEEDEKKILWKGDKEGELLPFKDGIAAWLKSDEGKEYLPAARAGGGGTRHEGGGGKLDPNAEATDADIGSIISNQRRAQ